MGPYDFGELIYPFLWLMMDLITAFLLCYAFLTPREGKAKLFILLGTVILAVVCNGIQDAPNLSKEWHLWDFPSPMETAVALGVVLLGVRLMFTGRWHQGLVAILALYTASILLFYLLLDRVSERSGTDLLPFYWAKDSYRIIVTTVKMLAFFLVWLLFGLYRRKSGKHTVISWLLLLIPMPTLVLLLMLEQFGQELYHVDYQYRILRTGGPYLEITLAVICTVFVISANGAAVYLLHISQRNAKKTAEMGLLRQQMDIQTQNYLALEKSYRAQRAAAHEFSHHLNTMHALLESRDYETLSQYVDRLQERQTTRIFSINSHHPIIDAVLNQKHQAAKELGIDIQVQVNDLSGISIPIDALVVLLSNLLDNAIEGCVGEKRLRLSFLAEDALFLSVENTSAPVTVINGRLVSSKHDSKQHGYGLENVRLILDELHAEYTFRYQNGWFRFAAEIPINKLCS